MFTPRNAALWAVATMLVAASAPALAGNDDPLKVDPKHYKLEFENASVRVIRGNYGPHEKGVMHSHPVGVAIYITDGDLTMTTADGKSERVKVKAGTVAWHPAGSHTGENMTDKPFEVVVVELKGVADAPKK